MSRSSPLRCLVTGGAGFLGSHLCDRLLADGHEVICLDNFVTGSRANIAHLVGRPDFTLVEHDVERPFDIAAERIFNLACPASPPRYQADPVRTTRTSVMGAINALDLATRNRARVFQASTSEIYGDPEIHPQPESYWGHVNTFGPRACYDEGKRAAETLFADYQRQFAVDIRVARIFNTYGPRMAADDGRVVSNFIVQALSGDDVTLYGDGSQTRSFCYVDDLIEGIVRLMDCGLTTPVNLGMPTEFTMRQLAELVVDLTNSRSTLVYRPLPQDDPRQRCPDITLARSALSWSPSVPLLDGLKRTVAWFDTVLATADRRQATP
jgi:UDP-glucuronate decarboxylase